jgi:glycerol transport system permease protein
MAINALFGFQTDIGLVMAMTVISVLPGLMMICFVRNHFARGLMVRA